MKKIFLLLISVAILSFNLLAQSKNQFTDYYTSWGYNHDIYFAPVDIHISQPILGNDYTFTHVIGHDKKEYQHIIKYEPTVPQYNIRLGGFWKSKWIFELNFDHTKFVATVPQTMGIKGTMNNRPIDTMVVNSNDILNYQLNNGANFFCFNVGRKWNLIHTKDNDFKMLFLLKAGAGFVYPHVQNVIFGKPNKPHFQPGGVNAGIEGALRFQFYNYIYLEPAYKIDYARYWGLRIYEGKASQQLYTAEIIWSLGINYPLDKKKTATSTN